MTALDETARLPDAAQVRLRAEVVAAPPYRQGRLASPSAFKLSSNENPFPPLPGVLEALQSAYDLNRYPDAAATRLRERLASRHGVQPEEVHVGAGSVSLLAQFIQAVAGPGDEVLYAWRSFEAYPGLVTVAGATSVTVPNRDDGTHDLTAMAEAITPATRVIIVCSPNNPTGPTVSSDEFERFMARVPHDVLVLLDEAYVEFVRDRSAVDGLTAVRTYPNLVALRTFSKAYGLAGLRVGWAIGSARLLDAARATAIPLSVTGIAEEAALASLDREDELFSRVDVLVQRRDAVAEALRDAGWRVPQTQSNFIWLATGDQTEAAAEIFAQHDLVVRPFSGSGIRASIGEPESVDNLLEVARVIVDMLPPEHAARVVA